MKRRIHVLNFKVMNKRASINSHELAYLKKQLTQIKKGTVSISRNLENMLSVFESLVEHSVAGNEVEFKECLSRMRYLDRESEKLFEDVYRRKIWSQSILHTIIFNLLKR